MKMWKEIPGFGGRYIASTDGEIASVLGTRGGKRDDPKILRAYRRKATPHLRVPLQVNKQRKYYAVHRLILLAFVGKPPDGHVCAHKDGNAQNNRLENLRWATPMENCRDRDRHGTTAKGERQGFAKLSDYQRREIIERMRNRIPGDHTARDLGRKFGVTMSSIFYIYKKGAIK